MSSPNKGVLAIWHDIDPSDESDFQEWHARQHMPERLSVPGFLRGSRYVAAAGSPRVFNFYLTENQSVLTSPAYLTRLNNPTDWTARVVPTLRNVNRSAGRVVASYGRGQGGAIATLQVSPLPANRDQFKDGLVESGLQLLLEQHGIVAAHLWKADSAASRLETAESRARTNSHDLADWTIAIEGSDVEFVRSASEWLLQQEAYVSAADGADSKVGIYRLQHHLEAGIQPSC